MGKGLKLIIQILPLRNFLKEEKSSKKQKERVKTLAKINNVETKIIEK